MTIRVTKGDLGPEDLAAVVVALLAWSTRDATAAAAPGARAATRATWRDRDFSPPNSWRARS